MEGRGEEGVVDALVVVEGGDERGDRTLIYLNHFVFAVVDGAGYSVGFVVVHGVADAHPAHEVGDARPAAGGCAQLSYPFVFA